MRDFLVLAIIFGSLPICFLRPWIGILVFAWVGYMNPHRYCWGIAYNFPVGMVVGIATLTGLFFTGDRSPLPKKRETLLILLLWLIFTFTSFQAFYPHDAWPQWEKVSKIFLMTLVTTLLINNKKKLRYLFLVIALSIGLIGIKGGIFGFLTGGRWIVYGPMGSFIAGNNDLALALNMVLPILLYLAREEKDRRLRIALYSTFFLSMVSVILTFSRGGFLGLLLVIFLILIKSKHKLLAGMLVGVGLFVATIYVPGPWSERMHTIETYEEDPSVLGRFNAWHFAWNLAVNRPLNGGGFGAFNPDLFEIYAPDPDNYHDAHSIYFEVLGEHGFIAFGLFISLLTSCFLSLRKLKKGFHRVSDGQWGINYADMIQISLAVYAFEGGFLGRAYFDLFYHLVACVILLKVFLKESLRSQEQVFGTHQ